MGEPLSGGSPIVYNSFRRFAGRPPASGENPAAYPAIPPVSERTRDRNGEDGTRRYSGSNACPIFCRSPARSFSVDSLSAYGQTHEPDARAGYGRLPKRLPVSGEPRFSGRYIRYLIYSLVYQTCPAVISRCRLCGAARIEYGRQPRTKGTNRKSVRENQRRIIGMPYMLPVLIRDRVRFRSAPAVRLFGPSA